VNVNATRDYFLDLQARIVARLETLDGQPFRRDEWTRPEGGGGISRLIEEGNVLERGGVNFSHVKGDKLPPSASAGRAEIAGRAWEAMGVSLVLHPRNPYAPTVHLNVRMFVAHAPSDRAAEDAWWFGGGMDLTPYYGFEEDAIHFHRTCRDALAPFGADVYPKYKRWCDDYFYLRHRKEPRGIGGIFYDRHDSGDWERDFAFTRDVGEAFLAAYPPIARARMNESWTDADRDEQLIRRGRYVEFNLLYDRGTMFGLKMGGNIETILSSMPPLVRWP